MRATLPTIVFLLVSTAQTSTQTPAPDSVKAELRTFTQELNVALQTRDRAALERLYAPGFTFVHALGAPVDRATQIANALAATPRGGSLPMPNLDTLVVSGDLAILRNREEGRYSLQIFTKAAGHWQVLHLQGTPIPASKPAVTVPLDVLRSYAGRFEQDNKLFVNITVEGEGLILQVDGRQRLALTAVTSQLFNLPGGAGTVTFAADGTTYEVRRGNGEVIKGTKQ